MPELNAPQSVPDAGPIISVVIAHYNYAAYVGDAIESVLAQSYPAFEIIVVDDGSTDHSAQVLRRYEDWITLYRQDKAGVSSARNLGIRHASGEWVALLDSDDMWEPDLLATYAQATRDYPQAGMIVMGRRIMQADGTKTAHTQGPSAPITEFTTQSLLSGDAGQVITPLLRRDIFNLVGGFDEQLLSAEDCDLALRMSCVTSLIGMNLPLILKREHACSLSGDRRLNARMWLNVLAKFKRNVPDLVSDHRQAYCRSLGRDYLRLGRETLYRYKTPRQLAAARYYLIRAIRVYPRHTRAFVYLIWSYLHPSSYRRWRRWELRIKEPLRQPKG